MSGTQCHVPEYKVDLHSLRIEISNKVAHFVLNRPEKRNCLTKEFWYELPKAVSFVESRDDVRCILLRSEGAMFCSGIDLAVLEEIKKGSDSLERSRKAEHLRRTVLSLQNAINCLENTRFPVIAAIQGGCIGGGLDLVCAADIRVAEQSAYFVPLEMDLGFVPDLGTVQRLSANLPQSVVADWLLDCRALSAEDVYRIGFVSRIVSGVEESTALAERIAERSPLATMGAKEMMKFTRENGVAASLRYIAAWQSGVFPGADFDECMQARRSGNAPEHADMLNSPLLLGAEARSQLDR